MEFYLFYHEIICCVYLLESAHRDITLSGSNYPCLEPKMFEPLKFYCACIVKNDQYNRC